jgi:hypothetical protein
MSTTKGVVYDFCYVLDDAPEREDIDVGIGFEFDADHGCIQWITRDAARQLYAALAKSIPFGAASTESTCTIVVADPRTEHEP